MERLTGQTKAADVNVELQLMMPLDSLINPNDPKAAIIPGYGPPPTGLAWEIVASSQGRKWWRRLFTAPGDSNRRSGPIVAGDPTRRHFDGWLAKLIKLRDQNCRDPYCEAPIRHIDHITRHSDNGPTILQNGRGTCERGNHVREMPGWHIKPSTAASTPDHTRSSSPHPPATTTSAAHQTHHENRSVRKAGSDR